MAYSVQADLEKAAGGTENLKTLTDIEATGAIDTAAMDAAIEDADMLIDSYAQRRYDVPFASPTNMIVQLSAREAVYSLKVRRNSVTEMDMAQHEERLDWLDKLSRGHVTPGVDPVPTESTAVVPEILDRSEDEDISRDSISDGGFV